MNLDEAKRAWQAHPDGEEKIFSEIVTKVRSATRFESTIFRRDLIESAAAVFVIVSFTPALFRFEGWLEWLGVLVIDFSAVEIMAVLHFTRRRDGSTPADVPLKLYFERERVKVERQIWLLRNVLWWYLGPCYIGVCMVLFGLERSLSTALLLCAGVTALYAGIWYINQRCVRRELIPLRQSFLEMEQELEEPPQSESGDSPSA